MSTESFDVDLDTGHPSAVPVSGQRDFPYKVSETDPEVFYATAHAQARDVSWYLEPAWSSGGRPTSTRWAPVPGGRRRRADRPARRSPRR